MPQTKPTQARGASIEREAIRDFLERRLHDPLLLTMERETFREVLQWINSRTARYNPRPGGLGKRPIGQR